MGTPNTATTLMRERYLDYFEPSYPCRLLTMFRDIQKPRSSPGHRVAVMDMHRLSAQVAAMLLTALALSLLLLFEVDPVNRDRLYEVQWTASAKEQAPDKIENPVEPDNMAEPSPIEAATLADADSAALAPEAQVGLGPALPMQQRSPLSALTETLQPIRGMPGFKKLIGDSRGSDVRSTLLADRGGDQKTEDAVLRSLRWLKKNQQADGSWKSQKIAMTGLALLTFLAHDERPSYSPEFGETVQKALGFLIGSQKPDGRFNGVDGNEYAHPIATYALCEAYGMTLNPNVKDAAERALLPIIKGQHPTGGWNYKMDPNVSKEDGKYRDDTSYMGWCAQALKAAKLAQLHADGLDKAIKLTVKGFQKNANPTGGFGYTAPGQGGLTSVGTLCMQLLGASTASEVRKSLALMDTWRPSFDAKSPLSGSIQYSCYYATQAKFHAGGRPWADWNREMTALYLKVQQIDKGAIKDDKGRDADIGWWVNQDAHTDRPVMDTCLAALQLMVYYRNLPTTGKAATKPPEEALAAKSEKGDIPVLINNL